ncbi:hypothetical protein VTO42DRAFT_8131 [Malbranchea cinnamomea]
MLRPPVNRGLRVLDRSLFKATFPLASATVFESKNISRIKNELMKSKDIMHAPGIMAVKAVQDIRDKEADLKRKCVLLRQEVKVDDKSTWSPTIRQLVEAKDVDIRPYLLELDYDHWTYHDIMQSILPEDMGIEIPTGYSQVGHVAHFNLRDEHLPYRHIIGQVLIDKQASITTVINKVEEVGLHSKYRTFAYEVLAGDGNMNVVHKEQGCEFAFDFSKVYWNTRLSTEHERLVGIFKEGEAVCDVMAGVGPFALPAGKKRVFVWANDINPHGYEMMKRGAVRNKVDQFVKAFNMDGRDFIPWATKELYTRPPKTVKMQGDEVIRDPRPGSPNRMSEADKRQKRPDKQKKNQPIVTYTSPRTFDHYVMNLPATAIEFLPAFIGVYAGQEHLFEPHTDRKLPLIHVYCFSTNSDDCVAEIKDICERLTEQLGYPFRPEDCKHEDEETKAEGSNEKTGESQSSTSEQPSGRNEELELQISSVRLVAPSKRMFRATFRLPKEIAFKKN